MPPVGLYAVKLVNGHIVHLTAGQYVDVVTTCGVAGVLGCFLMFWMWSNML